MPCSSNLGCWWLTTNHQLSTYHLELVVVSDRFNRRAVTRYLEISLVYLLHPFWRFSNNTHGCMRVVWVQSAKSHFAISSKSGLFFPFVCDIIIFRSVHFFNGSFRKGNSFLMDFFILYNNGLYNFLIKHWIVILDTEKVKNDFIFSKLTF